jgi:hypothetical protein
MNTDLDIHISSGLLVKVIARTGEFTNYGNASSSNQRFHGMMDGAGIVPLPDGGYVYLSNSKEDRYVIGHGFGGKVSQLKWHDSLKASRWSKR